MFDKKSRDQDFDMNFKKKFHKIISTHVPKTAGTSLMHMFYHAIGKDNILHDYDDDPVNPLSRFSIDPDYYERDKIETIGNYKVVHGHFSPSKYKYLKNAFRFMFLRHPVDNVISIYYYWKTINRTDSPILNYVRDNNLSLIEFASLPKIRWLYTKTYFGGFDMSLFDFIGNFNRFEEDLIVLSKLLEIELDQKFNLNRTGENNALIKKHKEESITSKQVRKKLEILLYEDINFFNAFAK